MKSMTGFGSAVETKPDFECKVEIKSVNHRYLNILVKAPKEFFSLEEKVRQKVNEYLDRGRIEVRIYCKFFGEDQLNPVFNQAVAANYYEGLKELKKMTGEEDNINFVQILAKMPEVFSLEKKEIDAGDYWPTIEKAVGKAVFELNKMKTSEGQAMKNDILEKQKTLKELVGEIKGKSPIMYEQIKDRFVSKFDELVKEGKLEKERMIGEAALFAEKTVIDEEIVRLESHFDQLEEILEEDDALGRKLDFLLQEINREINTIAAKSSDEEISKKVIEVKSQVEKVREQAQNVE
ncbi:YicC/YloC family endoribonuclease [Natranaerofaba carboxydovora]|uniref:YicC/YloC family endoribonuclease n=1 Tax=Natranaerofaba carboxydovora TaxID=2742683 RepID=UPI001F148243|nr:YicC/YloC family endoribonuclease [Natranaerofaba carboxydovora]UMZ73290.1 hypothetical protein ACONDI_00843 [Natranaerofaba carboxydovora]